MPKSVTPTPAVSDDEVMEGEVSASDDRDSQTELDELAARCEQLSAELLQAQERERRALADYNNVVRRSQEQQAKSLKVASVAILESFFTPLDHLRLAMAQLADPGLNMVGQQFQQVLSELGVEELAVLHQPFDAQLMEAIGKQTVSDPKFVGTVTSVQRPGYRLHGEVIRPAQVLVGELGTPTTATKSKSATGADPTQSTKE